MTAERICIVGAGSSGLVAAKALKEAGLAFDVFETGSDIGGMWRYENDNGMSSAYRSLHIDTSRRNLGYPDFPIPAHYPDFPSHAQLLAHLEAYCDRFGLRPHIRFQTRVEAVRPADGGWDVTTEDGETARYRAVIVANGHLWDPRWPAFPGEYSGQVLHSHDYRTPAPFEGREVVVVGFGNSALDVAVDLARHASSVTLSTRRGGWLMPKYLLGIPTDRWSAFLSRKLNLSTKATRAIMARLVRLTLGDQRRFGVPRPSHPIWREHAAISQELLPYVGHGRIVMAPNIARLDGESVEYVDGTRRRADAIVYATGYKASFPFLEPEVFAVRDGEPVRLYRRMVSPDHAGLYFVGLVQPIGPTIPLAEVQGRWLAAVLSGKLKLPGKAAMEAEIDAHRREVDRTYLGTARYALEVDYKRYVTVLSRELG